MAYPLLKKRRVLAAAIESTVGTAESLDAGDAAFNVFDAVAQPNIELIERQGQGVFSPLPGVLGAWGGTSSFSLHLCGSGTANDTGGDEACPNWAEVFLPACGFTRVDDAAVYKPNSTSPSDGSTSAAVRTITIGSYVDGVKKALKGCMGTAVFTFVAGQPVQIDFTFTGLWVAPTDVAILAPTYPTVKPPRWAKASTGITIASWSPRVRQITIDLGNQVTLREDANTAEGYISAVITDRRINGSLDPEAMLVAGNDAHDQWISYTEQALAMSLGAGSDGNTVAFAAPKLQFDNVQEGDRNGVMTDDITYHLNRSAAAGDDDLTISFS